MSPMARIEINSTGDKNWVNISGKVVAEVTNQGTKRARVENVKLTDEAAFNQIRALAAKLDKQRNNYPRNPSLALLIRPDRNGKVYYNDEELPSGAMIIPFTIGMLQLYSEL